ncbi:MAG: hypothetical protein RLY31_2444 [Bacteroidota bacterium]|jgi:nitroreductase
MYSDTFLKIVERRRSNRSFNPDVPVPDEVIRAALECAVLAPNSSNMQLWEFHWIRSPEVKERFVPLCLDQSAARTAQQLVVFVTRRDRWKERARWNYERVQEGIQGEPNKLQRNGLRYYGQLVPWMYRSDPFGFMGAFRYLTSWFMGLLRPFPRLGGSCSQRVVVHKSCALAAQQFMLAIAAADFDTCPMEGFDARRVRRALGLPRGAEINMVIGVGKGTERGVWGPRYRVPFDHVVFRH